MIKHLNTNGTAIKLLARNEVEGVDLEYAILDRIFGKGWIVQEQMTLVQENSAYDRLVVESLNGVSEIWFDIAAFFGTQ
jgi:hypothetical protein